MASDGAADEYWLQARRPLTCLVFLLPLLIGYELGVLWWGGSQETAVRNGADAWMRLGLERAGIEFGLLLPVLIILALFAWHLAARHPWRLSPDTLVGMLAESLLFAFLLVIVGQLQNMAFERFAAPGPSLSVTESAIGANSAARAITYVGAGIYEEFLFRLCLLPAVYGSFRLIRVPPGPAAAFAVIVTSALFSLAHHIGPTGEPFEPFACVFRAVAGLFFSLLFVLRGFGVTVGCHAAYDLLVGVLLVDL